VPLLHRNGHVVEAEFNMSATTYEGCRAGLVFVRDVTERRRAERALRAEERERAAILDGMAELVAFQDTEGRIIWANRAAAESVGAEPADLVGRYCYEVWHGRGARCEACPVAEALETGRPVTGEMTSPDGRVWLINGSPVFDEEREVVGTVEVTLDITRRKRAEQALRESTAGFRAIYERAPIGFQSLSEDGRLTDVNPAWLDMLGYPRGEVVGRWFGEFLAPESAEEFAGGFDAFKRAGGVRDVEYEMVRGDGSRMIALVHGVAACDVDGRFVRTHCILQDITERRRAEERTARRADSLERHLAPHYEMVGESAPMQAVYEFIRKVAPTHAGVLICGESGTGKEMVARAIHRYSLRSEGPVEIVNCAAMPATLLESEMFGHVKGAFTGAVADKPGCFELADGGTLFLDEVAGLSPECQAKLLRALEDGCVRRVGGLKDRPVDVRLVAATNRDPAEAMKQGVLRGDLFYRLDRLRVVLPPLRERGADIRLLAEHFLRPSAASLRGPAEEFAPDVLEVFSAYAWPGNVRELKNVVERMVILSDGPVLHARLIPEDIRGAVEGQQGEFEPLAEVEKRHILRALDAARGNKTRAAEMLGIDRSTLYARLKGYGQ